MIVHQNRSKTQSKLNHKVNLHFVSLQTTETTYCKPINKPVNQSALDLVGISKPQVFHEYNFLIFFVCFENRHSIDPYVQVPHSHRIYSLRTISNFQRCYVYKVQGYRHRNKPSGCIASVHCLKSSIWSPITSYKSDTQMPVSSSLTSWYRYVQQRYQDSTLQTVSSLKYIDREWHREKNEFSI